MSTISRFLSIIVLSLIVVAGCSNGGKTPGSQKDAGDSGSPEDGGVITKDAGHTTDGGGTKPDSGQKDGGGTASDCSSGAGCPSPATCDTSGAKPVCVCPKGYKFDGTKCADIDECADAKLNDCAKNGVCKNTEGSFECSCAAPAYKGDGKSCACALGFSDASGKCLANDAKSCTGADECLHGSCVGGVCCATACDAPPACKSAEGVTCEDGQNCVYASLADDSTCDDGNACTAGDKCTNGNCVGDAMGVSMSTQCRADDSCGTGYHCKGDTDGTCEATAPVNCDSFGAQCKAAKCDPVTGCYAMDLEDGAQCDDGDPCTVLDTCMSATCTAGEARSCDDMNPCTDDGACVAGVGCPVPTNNTVACDDHNPCTTNDHCINGLCRNTVDVDCDDSNVCTTDSCDPSDTAGTPMSACRHMSNTVGCEDGDPCTAGDVCQNGSCTASSTAYSACPHAHGCTAGSPISCACDTPDYVSAPGTCVPNTDECQTNNPCVSSAACTDPSSAAGDATCSCPSGTGGDGRTAGTGCTPCGPTEVSVNHVCVCNLAGTFAIQSQLTLSWSAVTYGLPLSSAAIEAGSGVPTTAYALRKQTYDTAGNLTVVTMPCGQPTPDFCSALFKQAYGEHVAPQMWGTTKVKDIVDQTNLVTIIPASGAAAFALPNARVGQPYNEPQSASLLGIHLTDSLGAWPGTRGAVGADAAHPNGTTGAYFVDSDGDSKPGGAVTYFAVPPGTNSACPRTAPPSPAGPYPYAYWPDPALTTPSITLAEFYLASRSVSNLQGSLTKCDSQGITITGTVHGPDGAADTGKLNGQMSSEVRVASCLDSNGHTCPAATIDALDTQPQTQHITGGTFIIKAVAEDTTCTTVRTMTFP